MFIDLTHRLNPDTPVYPGDAPFTQEAVDTINEAGYLGHKLSMGSHAGTHIDAPAHMISGGKTLDKYGVDQFIGPGKYILAADNTFDIAAVKAAAIEPGDIVVFNTAMSYKFYSPEYFTDFPVLSEEIAHYLVEKQVKMVGLDTPSADNSSAFPIHKILLGAGIPIIENLTNLEQLSGLSAIIYALPLKTDIDGAPARVIAEIR